MKTSNKFLFLISITIISFSCKKSTETITDFLPLTVGSNWTYKNTPGGTYTLTITNKDTAINAKNYKVLTNSNGPNNYQTKIISDYYRYVPTNALPGLTGLEELFLKDNLTVNGIWQTLQPLTIPGIGAVTLKLNYKVVAMGVSKVVSTVTYNDCIQIQLSLVASLGLLGETNVGGGDFYYARGVGLVTNSLNISIPGQAPFSQTTDLQSYVIK